MNIRYHVAFNLAGRLIDALVGARSHYARRSTAQDSARYTTAVSSTTLLPRRSWRSSSTVYRTKRRFVEGNLEAALNEEPRASGSPSDRQEQGRHPPEPRPFEPARGRARWTLELLAGAMVKLTDHHGRAEPSTSAWWLTISSPGSGPARCSSCRGRRRDGQTLRMCSTSMPSSLTQSGRWSASTKAPPSSSAKRASRFRRRPPTQTYKIAGSGFAGLFVFQLSPAALRPHRQGHRSSHR